MLREILTEYRSRIVDPDPAAFVFTTASGRPRDKDNVRTRVLAPCVADANTAREEHGLPRLPHVTPHTLRRTFISLLLANNADVPYVMGQVGHTDEGTTLRIYAKVLNRDRRHVGVAVDEMIAQHATHRPGQQRHRRRSRSDRLAASSGPEPHTFNVPPGAQIERLNQSRLPDDAARTERIVVSEVVSTNPMTLSWRSLEHRSKPEKSRISRNILDGRGWFRTSDLSRVKRALSH